MQVAIITDTHFGARADSLAFLSYQEKFYDEVFFPTLIENKIDTILHLGDLYERRKYINFVTLKKCKEMFLNKLQEYGMKMHIVVGNHDTYYKDTNSTNSLDLLISSYPNITVHEFDPVTLEIDGTKIVLSPWIAQDNYLSTMEYLNKTDAQIVMGHFEIAGFEVLRGTLCDHGLDKNIFNKFDIVYSGHFHHPSSHDNITYLGAPYEITWSDYQGKRGFHLFNPASRELTFVQNPFRLFHKIEYDDSDLTIEDINALDTSMLAGTYIKVLIKSKNNPYLFDLFLDKITLAGAVDVKTIDDSLSLEGFSDDDTINEAEDTITLLTKYVDSMEIRSDRAKINNMLITLYQEAINQ